MLSLGSYKAVTEKNYFFKSIKNKEDKKLRLDVQNEDILKLSISHEEELVAMAIKMNSPMKAIKWYYQKYRPDDHKRHCQNHDWSKNCRIRKSTVAKFMINFKKSGYHRLNHIKKMAQKLRPETGVNSIQNISLTEYQQHILVSKIIENGACSYQDAIKARFEMIVKHK